MDTSKDKRNLINKVVQQTTLPITEASVQERQVTVQVLTVGTKQVTQALYRQLVEQDIMNSHTGLLKGIPWGWVNLHSDCDEKKEHLHVVWEDKGQLKRACTYKSFDTNPHYKIVNHDLRFLTLLYVCSIALEGKKLPTYIDGKLVMDVSGYHYSISPPSSVQTLWELPTEYNRAKKIVEEYETKGATGQVAPQQGERRVEDIALRAARRTLEHINTNINEAKRHIQGEFQATTLSFESKRIEGKEIHKLLSELGFASYCNVYSEMEKKAKELASLTNNWMTNYTTIEQQGQLFIAVSGVWK